VQVKGAHDHRPVIQNEGKPGIVISNQQTTRVTTFPGETADRESGFGIYDPAKI
jgi:hypothetical protein